MQEYKSACMHKKRENADHLIIRVKNHKTFATAGPALLVFDAPPHVLRIIFLCHGLGMQWHQVQLANRSILNGSKRACLTRIGQEIYPAILYEESVTTANREENVGEPQQVADLMAHSLETAGKVYHMREKMKTAAKATATIKNHFDKRKRTAETNETSPEPVKNERKRWCSDEITIIKTTFNNEIRSGNIRYQQVKEKCSSINVNASPQQIYQKV